MSKRDYVHIPQDASDEDIAAVIALMTPAAAGEPVRRLYTESGPNAKGFIASVAMTDAAWTAAIPLIATAMYDTVN
ncbi:hypothetical protein VPHK225_0003 [Vibrio phage K225]|nr:hypothetical protein PODOV044v1_p0006 [Vibrio phage 23E28.1]QZI92085.1 hypothetical protein PODOV045v1_p0043 [Vibrio phage 69E27.1]